MKSDTSDTVIVALGDGSAFMTKKARDRHGIPDDSYVILSCEDHGTQIVRKVHRAPQVVVQQAKENEDMNDAIFLCWQDIRYLGVHPGVRVRVTVSEIDMELP
jgi:hypothetical protein